MILPSISGQGGLYERGHLLRSSFNPSLTQTTTVLWAAILPSIPLPAPRATPLAERERPKFSNTGLSASDDHSANVAFKEPTFLGLDVHFLQIDSCHIDYIGLKLA